MLVPAILPFSLAIVTMGSSTVTLEVVSTTKGREGKSNKLTLILLSLHGTQAVVTCLRGAFLGFSD